MNVRREGLCHVTLGDRYSCAEHKDVVWSVKGEDSGWRK